MSCGPSSFGRWYPDGCILCVRDQVVVKNMEEAVTIVRLFFFLWADKRWIGGHCHAFVEMPPNWFAEEAQMSEGSIAHGSVVLSIGFQATNDGRQ